MNANNKIFDLEQRIMNCWSLVDDVKLVAEKIGDDPAMEDIPAKHVDTLQNLLLGLECIYQLKFERLFSDFEDVCRVYHQRGKRISELQAKAEVLYKQATSEPATSSETASDEDR